MEKHRFYYCQVCGNIIEKIHDSGNELTCCMRTMMEIEPGTTDGKIEFHVPICEISNDTVTVRVGQEPHPMAEDHYIEWIELITDKSISRKYLKPGEKAEAKFCLFDGEKVCAIYAYCNKHKLWKAKCNLS